MGLASRIGDSESGICDLGLKCCPHSRGGNIGTGAPNVLIEASKAARIGDSGSCNCAHGGSFQITSGSSTVFINNRRSARISDGTSCMSCGCGGSITTGARSVYIGG